MFDSTAWILYPNDFKGEVGKLKNMFEIMSHVILETS